MKKVAVFAAGRGSNFEQFCISERSGFLSAKIALLVASKPDIGAIDLARKFDIPYCSIQISDFPEKESYNKAFLDVLDKHGIEIIALAGWLRLIDKSIIAKFQNKILNIHPALLPFFGGKGMYGHHVHEAVWKSGMLVSGATVHIVDPEYDHGRIIIQKSVQLDFSDTPDSIADKVLKIEHEIYPKALKLLSENRIDFSAGRLQIKKADSK